MIWVSWVDDCLICGDEDGVQDAKSQMKELFDCNKVGKLKEYVGCKIDNNKEEEGWIQKLTQPVLMQSYAGEFELPEGDMLRTPATPGSVLRKGGPKYFINEKEQSTYRSRVGKLLATQMHDDEVDVFIAPIMN
jgi:hypothetical protein